MRLEVMGGDSVVRQVRLKALLPEGQLVFSSKALDLGGIPVGVPQTSLVTLKNTGLHDAMFQVSHQTCSLQHLVQKGYWSFLGDNVCKG